MLPLTGGVVGFGVGFGVGAGVVGAGVAVGVAVGFGVATGVAVGFGVAAGVAVVPVVFLGQVLVKPYFARRDLMSTEFNKLVGVPVESPLLSSCCIAWLVGQVELVLTLLSICCSAWVFGHVLVTAGAANPLDMSSIATAVVANKVTNIIFLVRFIVPSFHLDSFTLCVSVVRA
jgi:hypothetical protein